VSIGRNMYLAGAAPLAASAINLRRSKAPVHALAVRPVLRSVPGSRSARGEPDSAEGAFCTLSVISTLRVSYQSVTKAVAFVL